MKAWLAGKTQSLIGVRALVRSHEASEVRQHALQQTLVELQSRAQQRAELADALMREMAQLLESINAKLDLLATLAAGRAATETAPRLDDAEPLERLESQGLFILGSARSGTSVLAKCLNRSREIMMLEEPNLFQNLHIQDFTAFFNAMHVALGNPPHKGTYISPPPGPEAGPLRLMLRLCRQYRYVGEKVAVGPHDSYPPDWKQLYLDFHAKYFLRSTHFLTIRTPNETLWSMHKLFPAVPVPRLIEAWLESLALTFNVYRVCPNSHLLFFNDFGKPTIERLSRLLDVEIDVPETMLGGANIQSRLGEDELPAPLAPYADLCRECARLFQELRENCCRESFRYCGAAAEWKFFAALSRRIRSLVERSQAANECRRAAA